MPLSPDAAARRLARVEKRAAASARRWRYLYARPFGGRRGPIRDVVVPSVRGKDLIRASGRGVG